MPLDETPLKNLPSNDLSPDHLDSSNPGSSASSLTNPSLTQDEVLNALKQCYDPEIPVNIVDLGLIYDIRLDAAPDNHRTSRST